MVNCDIPELRGAALQCGLGAHQHIRGLRRLRSTQPDQEKLGRETRRRTKAEPQEGPTSKLIDVSPSLYGPCPHTSIVLKFFTSLIFNVMDLSQRKIYIMGEKSTA